MLPYLILTVIVLSVFFMSCFAVKRIEVWAQRHFHASQENSNSRLGILGSLSATAFAEQSIVELHAKTANECSTQVATDVSKVSSTEIL